MLNYEQRLYLVKKVDRFALSDMRKTALVDYCRLYPGTVGDADQISDLIGLQRGTVLSIFQNA